MKREDDEIELKSRTNSQKCKRSEPEDRREKINHEGLREGKKEAS